MCKYNLPLIPQGSNCVLAKIDDSGEITLYPEYVEVLKDVSDGINSVQLVKYGNITGYKKNSYDTDNSEDIEMVINWFGSKLGIKMANTYRYISLSCVPEAIISENVAKEDYQQFLSMRDIRDILAIKLKKGEIKYEPWIKNYMKLSSQKAYPDVKEAFENIVYTKEQAIEVIEFGLRIIDLMPNSDHNKEHNKSAYLKMILLDSLTGQVDRTIGNYGFIYDEKCNTYSFAPLFDNATLRKPYTGHGICMVNNFIMERKFVFDFLSQKSNIKDIMSKIIKNKHVLLAQLSYVADSILDNEQYDMLMCNILMGIEIIEETLNKAGGCHEK